MLTRLRNMVHGMNTTPMPRAFRRFMIGIYAFTIAVQFASAVLDLSSWHDTSHFYGLGSFIVVCTAFGQVLFSIWLLRRLSFATSRDERAQLDFGRPYAQLSPMHQFDVRVRIQREMRAGGRPRDERDAVIQRAVEGKASRVQRIALPLAALAYWIFCLSMPIGQMRVGLLIGAVVLSAILIPILVLPDTIRFWTEPDAPQESHVIAINGEV